MRAITRSPKPDLTWSRSVDAHRDDPALQAQHRQAWNSWRVFRFYRIVPLEMRLTMPPSTRIGGRRKEDPMRLTSNEPSAVRTAETGPKA